MHNARKRLGTEAIAQLIADYQTGDPSAVLMKRYGLSKSTVLSILDEAGVTRKQRRATTAQKQEAAKLYGQGWSLDRIGQHLGFEDTTVWLWLKQLGISMRQPWERGP